LIVDAMFFETSIGHARVRGGIGRCDKFARIISSRDLSVALKIVFQRNFRRTARQDRSQRRAGNMP
jgi:hypothetical protein